MLAYLEWSIRTIANHPNITVRLFIEATPEKIRAERPDALVVAAGAEPFIPEIPA